MKNIRILIFIFTSIIFNHLFAQTQDNQPVQMKLYAIECGRIDVSNFAGFSDTGDYDNKIVQLANPCFLIVHPKGTLLWDTGLPDTFIKKPETVDVYHLTKSVSLEDSLKQINMKPTDITYVAVSHSHFDHMGSLNNFPQATWILQNAEVDYAKAHQNPFIIDASKLKNWNTVHKVMISSDHDVFGDGTVKILNMPGHTPGQQSLLLKLPHTGVIILSGDEFHQRSSFEPLQVPVFNTSRAETIASSDRLKSVLKNTHGRLIIQHDAKDFEALPKFPKYLD